MKENNKSNSTKQLKTMKKTDSNASFGPDITLIHSYLSDTEYFLNWIIQKSISCKAALKQYALWKTLQINLNWDITHF